MNRQILTKSLFAIPAGLIGMMAMPAPAQAPELAMLNKIDTGMWNFYDRESGNELVDRICVRDTRKLLQIRHRDAHCKRFVINDSPREVTVSYSCSGVGSGRTTIKLENKQLLQISSQGVADNSPFSFQIEGRYVGSCSN